MILFSSPVFSSHSPPPSHPERMERGGVFEAVAAAFRKGGGTVVEPRMATREELERAHTSRYLDAIGATLSALQRRFEAGRSILASHYDEHWRAVTPYSALDADCQIAMLWFLFSQATGDIRFANSALKMMDLVRNCIDMTAVADGVRGGLPGSFPVQGDNQRHACVNWAAKYFIDASLLEVAFRRTLEA